MARTIYNQHPFKLRRLSSSSTFPNRNKRCCGGQMNRRMIVCFLLVFVFLTLVIILTGYYFWLKLVNVSLLSASSTNAVNTRKNHTTSSMGNGGFKRINQTYFSWLPEFNLVLNNHNLFSFEFDQLQAKATGFQQTLGQTTLKHVGLDTFLSGVRDQKIKLDLGLVYGPASTESLEDLLRGCGWEKSPSNLNKTAPKDELEQAMALRNKTFPGSTTTVAKMGNGWNYTGVKRPIRLSLSLRPTVVVLGWTIYLPEFTFTPSLLCPLPDNYDVSVFNDLLLKPDALVNGSMIFL